MNRSIKWIFIYSTRTRCFINKLISGEPIGWCQMTGASELWCASTICLFNTIWHAASVYTIQNRSLFDFEFCYNQIEPRRKQTHCSVIVSKRHLQDVDYWTIIDTLASLVHNAAVCVAHYGKIRLRRLKCVNIDRISECFHVTDEFIAPTEWFIGNDLSIQIRKRNRNFQGANLINGDGRDSVHLIKPQKCVHTKSFRSFRLIQFLNDTVQ